MGVLGYFRIRHWARGLSLYATFQAGFGGLWSFGANKKRASPEVRGKVLPRAFEKFEFELPGDFGGPPCVHHEDFAFPSSWLMATEGSTLRRLNTHGGIKVHLLHSKSPLSNHHAHSSTAHSIRPLNRFLYPSHSYQNVCLWLFQHPGGPPLE